MDRETGPDLTWQCHTPWLTEEKSDGAEDEDRDHHGGAHEELGTALGDEGEPGWNTNGWNTNSNLVFFQSLEISFIAHSTEEKTRFGPKAAARPVRKIQGKSTLIAAGLRYGCTVGQGPVPSVQPRVIFCGSIFIDRTSPKDTAS